MSSKSPQPVPAGLDEALADPARLAALDALELIDRPSEAALDRLARLAARMLGAPVAMVSLVSDTCQFFTSSVGLPEPLASERRTPLSHSFCKHVVHTGEPLIVADARAHPLLQHNPALRDHAVVAYAGMPLRSPQGLVLGSFCVLDVVPRQWSADELGVLEDLAAAAMSELELRRLDRRSRRSAARLRALNAAVVAVNAARTLEETLQAVTEQAAALIGAHRATTRLVADPHAPRAPEAVVRSRRGAAWRAEGAPAAGAGPLMRPLLEAPLTDGGGRTIGSLRLAHRHGSRFTEEDEALLAQLVQSASVAIDKARAYEREHAIAATLQHSLLPGRLPAVAELDVAATYRPAGEGIEVGGDFYDLLELDGHGWGAVIGDVVGKGPRAAALTGLVRHTIRALGQDGRPPAAVLEALNDAILRDADELRFCTAVYAQLRPVPGGIEARLVAGGHPRPLLLRGDGHAAEVEVGGRLIGTAPGLALVEERLLLEPGDTLVLYTDGLSESARGRVAEAAELIAAASGYAVHGAAAVNRRLEDWALRRAGGTLPDDLALLTLTVRREQMS